MDNTKLDLNITFVDTEMFTQPASILIYPKRFQDTNEPNKSLLIVLINVGFLNNTTDLSELTLKRLAKLMHTNKATIRNHLNSLEAEGYLRVTHTTNRAKITLLTPLTDFLSKEEIDETPIMHRSAMSNETLLTV